MRISARGQITVPKGLRRKYGLWPNVEVELVETKDGLQLRKVVAGRHPVDEVAGTLGKRMDVDAYLEKARGR